jgi:SAM-dependent methyltransferase
LRPPLGPPAAGCAADIGSTPGAPLAGRFARDVRRRRAGSGACATAPRGMLWAAARRRHAPARPSHPRSRRRPTVKLTPRELDLISRCTIDDYEQAAEDFWSGTRSHDVSQNIETLLAAITAPPPHSILDFGCGPGRDLKTFVARGCEAIGLEGAAHFAAMARAYSGCEVWEQDFLQLDLPPARFDGIFANASLFHVPSQELPRVLGELAAALKPQGVLFSSNPRGNDEEGWNRGRYGTYHSLASWRRHLAAAGFAEIGHYFRPPGLPREQQPWLASTWRRSG